MSQPTALITGGASGIGLAIAEHLINSHGYRVAIIDIDPARVKAEAALLGTQKCFGITADVTDYTALSQAFVQAFEWGGNRLDFVFLNAGIGDTDSLYKDTSIDEATGLPKPLKLRIFDVDLHAVLQGMHLARHFFSAKNSRPGGKILITSSALGLYSNPMLPLYTAAKHALVGLVRSLAPVYVKDNISINALCPALIRTNLMPAHVAEAFHVPEQTTPMTTAFKAVDAVLTSRGEGMVTGQTMELALDEVVFVLQQDYATENSRWMCEDQRGMWEKVCEPVMPRPPGENLGVVRVPEVRRI